MKTQVAGERPADRKAARAARQNDPRWRRTREAILDAGKRLFGEHPPEGVSIDDLIRAAKVSKQSFYNHFPDKDGLSQELIRQTRAEVDALVTAANEGQTDPARRVVTGLCVYAVQSIRNRHQGEMLARLLLEDAMPDSTTNSTVVTDVVAGLTQGRLAIFTLDTGLAFLIGATQSLIRRILIESEPVGAMVMTQQFATLLLRAFGLPPIEAELLASEAADRIIRRELIPLGIIDRS